MDMSQVYPQPTPASSHYTTPCQTPRRSSPSRDLQVTTDPQFPDIEENGARAQELRRSTEFDNGILRSFMDFLNCCSAEIERREEERLAEYRRECEEVKISLQNERDTALSNLREEQTRAETNAENLGAQIQLHAERVSDLEGLLDSERSCTNELRNQLAERNNQLSAIETRYFTMEDTLLRSLSRTKNESNEFQKQLIETEQQIGMANSLVTEERSRSDNYRTELATASNKLEEVQRQRIAVEGELENRINELTTINDQLQEEIAQTRSEAGLLNTMRLAREELETRCQELTVEVSDLVNARRYHENMIKDLEEQRNAMSREVRRLNSELHDEQSRSTDLRLTISNRLRELDELKFQRNHLQVANDDLTNSNAELRANCGTLNAKIAELKSINNDLSRGKAKRPRYPAIVRYGGSSPKMALVKSGTVTIDEWPRK